MNLLVLTLPNEDDELVLETDASNYHWGAVLKIKKDNKLCRYSSGSFNKAECNYTVMEKEILAILKGINKFIIFLAPKPFTVRTDCKGILGFIQNNLDNMKAQGRLLRWQLTLNQFSFNIEHVQGSKNSLADSLTRELASNGNAKQIYNKRATTNYEVVSGLWIRECLSRTDKRVSRVSPLRASFGCGEG